jgi:hypothetical protein
MNKGLRFLGQGVPLPGSPVAVLRARVDAELAAGSIPCACPHPATADALSLPGKIFGCIDCVPALTEAADERQAPVCSCCTTSPATRTTGWATASSVIVLARVCATCQMTLNTPMSPN